MAEKKDAPQSTASVVVASLMTMLLNAWLVMLLLDLVHRDYDKVPALGYWASFAAYALWGMIVSASRTASKK